MSRLWHLNDQASWRRSLDRYEAIIAEQAVARLPELDSRYRFELPATIASRRPRHLTLGELVVVTEWKMARGVWRQRNLVLVRSNPPERVVATSMRALERTPDPRAPIAILCELDGVGPATASAVLATTNPETYPFFDDLVAAAAPGLGEVAYTASYYARYADALRGRAERIGSGWTPAMVERALWTEAGGKAGLRLD